jgi:hypothetical protein
VVTQFESSNGELPSGVVYPLVAGVNGSSRLRTYAAGIWVKKRQEAAKAARQEQQRKAEAARQEQQRKEEAAEQARRDEERTWFAARATGCAQPIDLKACQGVERYLVHYPNGAHANDARRAMAHAQPLLTKLQEDQNYWSQNSDWRSCQASRTRESCDGVELYIAKFPAGLHAGKARELQRAVANQDEHNESRER